jgi:hypothetical protein
VTILKVSRLKKCGINISGYFLLILFTGFFLSTILFNHTHISEGSIFVHSHPFKPDSNGKPLHSHSNSVYLLVFQLNNFIADINAVFMVDDIHPVFTGEIISGIVIKSPSGGCEFKFHLRGPPSLVA